MANKKIYVPSEEAINNPRTLVVDGELRCLGGVMEDTNPKPPAIGKKILEFTQKQYAKYYQKKGFKDRLIIEKEQEID